MITRFRLRSAQGMDVCHHLYVALVEIASEPLLFGKVVGIVQRGEIRDTFFRLFTRIRLNDLDRMSRLQSVQEIHQSIFVILA